MKMYWLALCLFVATIGCGGGNTEEIPGDDGGGKPAPELTEDEMAMEEEASNAGN